MGCSMLQKAYGSGISSVFVEEKLHERVSHGLPVIGVPCIELDTEPSELFGG